MFRRLNLYTVYNIALNVEECGCHYLSDKCEEHQTVEKCKYKDYLSPDQYRGTLDNHSQPFPHFAPHSLSLSFTLDKKKRRKKKSSNARQIKRLKRE